MTLNERPHLSINTTRHDERQGVRHRCLMPPIEPPMACPLLFIHIKMYDSRQCRRHRRSIVRLYHTAMGALQHQHAVIPLPDPLWLRRRAGERTPDAAQHTAATEASNYCCCCLPQAQASRSAHAKRGAAHRSYSPCCCWWWWSFGKKFDDMSLGKRGAQVKMGPRWRRAFRTRNVPRWTPKRRTIVVVGW
jgi:hypothetical protein